MLYLRSMSRSFEVKKNTRPIVFSKSMATAITIHCYHAAEKRTFRSRRMILKSLERKMFVKITGLQHVLDKNLCKL